jgi:hypothetical protein
MNKDLVWYSPRISTYLPKILIHKRMFEITRGHQHIGSESQLLSFRGSVRPNTTPCDLVDLNFDKD